jgi:hypothetical protein
MNGNSALKPYATTVGEKAYQEENTDTLIEASAVLSEVVGEVKDDVQRALIDS